MFLLIQMFLPFEDEAAETLNSIMFLLILESFLCRCVRQPPLNSIMFLLILLADLEYHLVRQIFKFHYVSINSAPVHPSLLCPKSLNSIMFLLIPQPFRDRAHNVYPFKFHYVSINSFAVLSSGIGKSYFKFHYVSINS